ncbi:MAG: hypothetical protein LWY06_13810 [Firmicutes bacterium]|nr:hypothetical protein [Bacillota bacterium]
MKRYPFHGTYTELIDYGFRLYLDHFKNYIVISFYAYMPFFMLLFASDYYAAINGIPLQMNCMSSFLAVAATQNPLIWIGNALIVYFSGLYIMGKDEYTAGWKATIKQVFWKVIAVRILILLITTGLTVASILILPLALLIYFGVTLSMSIPVVMLEGKGITESLNRAVELTKPQFAKTAVVLFLTGVLISIPQLAFNTGLAGAQLDQPWILLAIRVVTAIITIIVQPLQHIILTFLFFDLKHKTECVDLFLDAEKLEEDSGFTPQDKAELLMKMKRIKITKDMLGTNGENIYQVFNTDEINQEEPEKNASSGSGDKILITKKMLGGEDQAPSTESGDNQ